MENIYSLGNLINNTGYPLSYDGGESLSILSELYGVKIDDRVIKDFSHVELEPCARLSMGTMCSLLEKFFNNVRRLLEGLHVTEDFKTEWMLKLPEKYSKKKLFVSVFLVCVDGDYDLVFKDYAKGSSICFKSDGSFDFSSCDLGAFFRIAVCAHIPRGEAFQRDILDLLKAEGYWEDPDLKVVEDKKPVKKPIEKLVEKPVEKPKAVKGKRGRPKKAKVDDVNKSKGISDGTLVVSDYQQENLVFPEEDIPSKASEEPKQKSFELEDIPNLHWNVSEKPKLDFKMASCKVLNDITELSDNLISLATLHNGEYSKDDVEHMLGYLEGIVQDIRKAYTAGKKKEFRW